VSEQCRCQKGNLKQLCCSGCNIHVEGTDYNQNIGVVHGGMEATFEVGCEII
jgi:hypothetical protein